MIAVDKLRGVIAERGLSQSQVAKSLGMAEKTFYNKKVSFVSHVNISLQS